MSLIAISFDHYNIIIHPFRMRTKPKECFAILALIWLLSLLFSLMKLFNFEADFDTSTKNIICSPIFVKLYGLETIILVLIQFIFPFCLFLMIYLRIGYHLYFNNDERKSSIIISKYQMNNEVKKRNVSIFLLYLLFFL
jgi:hypothetical protein